MRTVAPWGANVKREMERLFDRFVESAREPFELLGGDRMPKLDISETKEAMVVKAEMRGVDPKDIEVTLMDGLLTLKGEREKAAEEEEERYPCVERTYGTFLRSVRLPKAVDGWKLTATFKNGVLVVTLPKTVAAKGTLIPSKLILPKRSRSRRRGRLLTAPQYLSPARTEAASA